MRFWHLFVLLSLFAIGFAAGRGDSDSSSDDDGPPTESCNATTSDQYYEVKIELRDLPDVCTEADVVNLGVLIQSIVCEVDESMPDYKEEYMNTHMCEVPEEGELESTRFLRVAERNLGRYSKIYLGAGHCRRCKRDNSDGRGNGRGNGNAYGRGNGRGNGNAYGHQKKGWKWRSLLRELRGSDDSDDEKRGDSGRESKTGSWKSEGNKKETNTKWWKSGEDSDGSDENTDEDSGNGEDDQEDARYSGEKSDDRRDSSHDSDDAENATSKNICEMSEEAVFANNTAQTAVYHAEEILLEMTGMAKDFQDEEEGRDFLEKARSEHNVVMLEANATSMATEVTMLMCEQSKNVTTKDELKSIEKSTKLTLKEATEASKEARSSFAELKEIRIAMKEEAYQPMTDSRLKETKTKVQTEQAELRKLLNEVVNAINELEAFIKTEKSRSKKKELERQKKDLEKEKSDIEHSMQLTEQALDEAAEWEQKLETAKLAVEGADTNSEWSEKFSDLINLLLPVSLLETYNATSGGLGCLTEPPQVVVSMTETEAPNTGETSFQHC